MGVHRAGSIASDPGFRTIRRQPSLVFNIAPAPFTQHLSPKPLTHYVAGKNGNPVGRRMLASAIAETFVVGLLYPLDTVKTIVQAGGRRSWTGLWRGIGATLPWVAVDSGLFVGVLEGVKTLLERRGLKNVGDWVGGGAAAIFSYAVFSPVEFIRDRMRVSGARCQDVVRSTLRSGVGQFWRGSGGRLARDLPHEVLGFGGFEWGLRAIARHKGSTDQKDVFLLGLAVGAFCGLLMSPVEYGVTRVVCNGGAGVRQVLKQSLRRDGLKDMFVATREIVLREMIGSGLYFFIYHELRNFGLPSPDD